VQIPNKYIAKLPVGLPGTQYVFQSVPSHRNKKNSIIEALSRTFNNNVVLRRNRSYKTDLISIKSNVYKKLLRIVSKVAR